MAILIIFKEGFPQEKLSNGVGYNGRNCLAVWDTMEEIV
jgi:hypothetical protein